MYKLLTTENSIITDSTRHVQIKLSVSKNTMVWIQLLLDCHIKNRSTQLIMLNIYELKDSQRGVKLGARDLYMLYSQDRVRNTH